VLVRLNARAKMEGKRKENGNDNLPMLRAAKKRKRQSNDSWPLRRGLTLLTMRVKIGDLVTGKPGTKTSVSFERVSHFAEIVVPIVNSSDAAEDTAERHAWREKIARMLWRCHC
jgi:hypothetical protein